MKGTIHWVSVAQACEAQVRLYDRLFTTAHPGRESGDYLKDLNSSSKGVVRAFLEPSLRQAKLTDRFQFERHGYFVPDEKTSSAEALVFNRAVTLRDSWGSAKH